MQIFRYFWNVRSKILCRKENKFISYPKTKPLSVLKSGLGWPCSFAKLKLLSPKTFSELSWIREGRAAWKSDVEKGCELQRSKTEQNSPVISRKK